MTIMVFSFGFLIASICAILMGFAIQRGATCTVAAIGEIVEHRRASRIFALAEASFWVTGGLYVALSIGVITFLPPGFSLTWGAIAGGVLLGFGAWVNRACVFGAIARLGSGQWAYALTPLGFFIGVGTVDRLFGLNIPDNIEHPATMSGTIRLLALGFGLFALWRIFGLLRSRTSQKAFLQHLGDKVWKPHEATVVIGISFVLMFALVGPWAYTDLLARIAHGMVDGVGWRMFLFGGLLAGAIMGGWTARRFVRGWPSVAALARCFTGGLLMGWGSALIPGGNDGLVLIGLPMFWSYAWVAIFFTCATIWLALVLERRFVAD